MNVWRIYLCIVQKPYKAILKAALTSYVYKLRMDNEVVRFL